MADLNPESKFSLSLKEVVGAVIGLSSLLGIYFTLQASVASNTEDIDALKNNSVNPVEFQYKDELVRSTIQRVEEKTSTTDAIDELPSRHFYRAVVDELDLDECWKVRPHLNGKEIIKELRCLQVNYVTFPTDWRVE